MSIDIMCIVWFPEKLRWCLIEQVCQGSKVKSGLSNPEDWVLRYIRTYLYLYLTLGLTADT